jgi:hypothetical protein
MIFAIIRSSRAEELPVESAKNFISPRNYYLLLTGLTDLVLLLTGVICLLLSGYHIFDWAVIFLTAFLIWKAVVAVLAVRLIFRLGKIPNKETLIRGIGAYMAQSGQPMVW